MIVTSLPVAAFAAEDVSLPAVVEEVQTDGEDEAHSHTFGAWNYDEENNVFVKECADCGETQQEEMPADVKALLDEIDADTAEDTLDAAVEDGFLTAAAAAYILSTVQAEEPATVAGGGEINLINLKYDDYYALDGLVENTPITTVGEITSKQVKVERQASKDGEGYSYVNTLKDKKDKAVVEVTEDDELHAVGIGTATVTVDGTEYTVTVEPARLSLFLLGGQSNMEGDDGDVNQSIANENGTVYASYGKNADLTETTGPSFIPSALVGKNSTTAVDDTTEYLKGYPVDSLVESGNGKKGMDSGIAYGWLQQHPDEKVWIVNAAHSGSSIQTWQPGFSTTNETAKNYDSAVAMYKAAQAVLAAEVEAGHYTTGNMGLFWCQGCANASSTTAKAYTDYFTKMYAGFKKEFGNDFDFADIILVRKGSQSDRSYYMDYHDLEMTGPRISQYWMSNSSESYNGVDLSEVHMVSNIGDQWVYDETGLKTVGKYSSVAKFFEARYKNGIADYPAQDGSGLSADWRKPTTPSAVHPSIHYRQVGYNEVGIEAATNATKIINGTSDADATVTFVSNDGYTPVSGTIQLAEGETEKLLVPIVDPAWMGKDVSVNDTDGFYTYTGTANGQKITASVKNSDTSVMLTNWTKEDFFDFLWTPDETGVLTTGSADDGYTENAATLISGSTSSDKSQNYAKYSLEKSVTLKHDKTWAVEWQQMGKVQGMPLANISSVTPAKGQYIWWNGTGLMLSDGATGDTGSNYNQYGIKTTSEAGIYRLQNVIDKNGNHVDLYKDGVFVETMATHMKDGNVIDGEGPDTTGLSGIDYTFNYIGSGNNSSNWLLSGKINYMQVWEDGYKTDNSIAIPTIDTDLDYSYAKGAKILVVASTTDTGATLEYQWYSCDSDKTNKTVVRKWSNDPEYKVDKEGYYICEVRATKNGKHSPNVATSLITYVSKTGTVGDAVYLWDFENGNVKTLENNNSITPNTNTTFTDGKYNAKGTSAINVPVVLPYNRNWVVEYKVSDGAQSMFALSNKAVSKEDGNLYIWQNTNNVSIGMAKTVTQNEKTATGYINFGTTSAYATGDGTSSHVIKLVNTYADGARKVTLYVDGILKKEDMLATISSANTFGDLDASAIKSDGTIINEMATKDFVFNFIGANGFNTINDMDYMYINTNTDTQPLSEKDLMANASTDITSYSKDATGSAITATAQLANSSNPSSVVYSYQWYLGEAPIEGETIAEYTPLTETEGTFVYKCKVTATDNSKTAEKFTNTVEITVTDPSKADYEWDFDDFKNNTFTANNGNKITPVDGVGEVSQSNGKLVASKAILKADKTITLPLNTDWTLEWSGTYTDGMILSGDTTANTKGTYYIWKSGNLLLLGISGQLKDGGNSDYRNLGAADFTSGNHTVKIVNTVKDGKNTISMIVDDVLAVPDITAVGYTSSPTKDLIAAADLKYIKNTYFSPDNTITFNFMGSNSHKFTGNIDYLKVYHSVPCDHSEDQLSDWQYDTKGAWQVCGDCNTILNYTPHVFTRVEAKPATCAETGNYAYDTCKVGEKDKKDKKDVYFTTDANYRKEVTLESVTIPTVPHVYGEWVVNSATTEGKYTLVCTCVICNVAKDRIEDATIPSISITTPPTKTEYALGETVSTEGMTVSATFEYGTDGATVSAPITGYTVGTVDTTTAGTKDITVEFGGQTATAEVTVAKGAYPLTLTADKTSMKGRGTVTLTVEGVPAGAEDALAITCDDTSINVTKVAGENGVFTVSLPNATKEYTFTVAENGFITANYEEGTASCTVNVTRKKSSSSDTSAPTYGVSVGKTENGKLTVDPANAAAGEKVTIKATPDSGYQLDNITVKDKNNSNVKLTKVDDNEYTFTMPGGKVSVDATFVQKDTKDDDQNDNTETKNPFVDVKASDWFYGSVLRAYKEGWMSGTSAVTFAPNASTTRGMIVSVLYRLEGSPEAGDSTFTDVKAGAYYAKAVAWAAENGIVGGYGDGTFGPNDEITREQLAAILYRYAQFKGYDVSKKADLTAYSDYAQVSAYAKDAVAWANAAGILSGTSATTLSPRDHATRAQVAAILARFTDAFEA